MTKEEVGKLAESCGFTNHGFFDVKGLKFLEEVRQMCAADLCQSYDKNWSCPPACGSLSETAERMHRYQEGILVQTTAELEDDFDAENMALAENRHKKSFMTFARQARSLCSDCLPLSAGTCTLCRSCTYPEKPCRFPAKRLSSMEAYGLLVSEVCTLSGLKYYYGPKTLTYSACLLYTKSGKDGNST